MIHLTDKHIAVEIPEDATEVELTGENAYSILCFTDTEKFGVKNIILKDNGKKMKVYISGPITGLPYEEAEKSFNEAEIRLQEQGYEVGNPLNNGLPRESTWNEHMRADIKLLLDCDAIYMLDGWEFSRGAQIEFRIAYNLGIKVINF